MSGDVRNFLRSVNHIILDF